jgi:hypothetical protein
MESLFGLHLALRSTDDRLNGTPLSGYRTHKNANNIIWLTFEIRSIGLSVLVVPLKNDRNRHHAMVMPKSAHGFKIFARALHAIIERKYPSRNPEFTTF